MKVLFTADIHLTKDRPEREEALKEILRIGKKRKVDFLFIAGDMFNEGADIEYFKPRLRKLLSKNNFKIFIIPGNHDQNAFRSGDRFGDDVEVLSKKPFSKKTLDKINLVAVPFCNKKFKEISLELEESKEKNKTNILLIHCTLLTGRYFDSYGKEERYLPVKLENLKKIGYDLVLAGHFHSSYNERKIEDTVFVYPGSPVSITKKEIGRRYVGFAKISKDGKISCESIPLTTFHYRKENVLIAPGEGDSKLKKLKEKLKKEDLSKCDISIVFKGFIEKDENEFAEKVKSLEDEIKDEIKPKGIRTKNKVRSVGVILELSLYKRFKKKLESLDLSKEAREDIHNTVLEAFTTEYR